MILFYRLPQMKLPSIVFLLVFLILSAVSGVGRSARPIGVKTAQTRTQLPVVPNSSLEQDQLAFERQKHSDEMALKRDDLAFRKDQLADEKSKRLWTVLSTVIPLLAVLFTIGYNAWLFRKQTEQSNKQRAEDANLQFELKAAEIAFTGDTPLDVRDRANVLKTMFKQRLSDAFFTDYDPAKFGEREGNKESKKFLLELLLKYPDPKQQLETVSFWKELFPGDVDWLARIHLSPHELPRSDGS
jgi:hypothetical protein